MVGFGLIALAFLFSISTVRAIWMMVRQSRQLDAGARLSLFWWLPAWRIHQRGYPASPLRNRIVTRFALTLVRCLRSGMRSGLHSPTHADQVPVWLFEKQLVGNSISRLKHSRFMPQVHREQTDGRVVNVESIYPRSRRQLIVTFLYEVRGCRYEGELYTFKSMNAGESLVVTYDALNPEKTGYKAKYARTWTIWWISMAAIFVVALLLMLWIRIPGQ